MFLLLFLFLYLPQSHLWEEKIHICEKKRKEKKRIGRENNYVLFFFSFFLSLTCRKRTCTYETEKWERRKHTCDLVMIRVNYCLLISKKNSFSFIYIHLYLCHNCCDHALLALRSAVL